MSTRIVKPPTAKQRASIERYKRHSSLSLRQSSAPARSWWVGLSREQLQEQSAQERARMTTSRFGRILGHGVIGE
jgi:hypothetical protein